MVAYLIVAGPRFAPVAFAARVTAVLVARPELASDDLAGVVLRAAAITAAYTVAAAILRDGRLEPVGVRAFTWFVTVGSIAAPVVASAAVALVEIGLGGVPVREAADGARTQWVGDAVAISSIVPAVLLTLTRLRVGGARLGLPDHAGDRVLALGQTLALVCVPLVVYTLEEGDAVLPFLFLAVLPAVWVAASRELTAAAWGVLVVNTVVALGARARLGATAELVGVQVVMLVGALGALYIGAVRRAQLDHAADLRARETELRALVAHSPDVVIRFDRAGHAVFSSEEGHDPTTVDAIRRHLAGSWEELPLPSGPDDEPTLLEWSIRLHGEERHLRTRFVLEPGDRPAILSITSDETDLRRATEALASSTRRDPLTGLGTRQALTEHLDRLLHPSSLPDRPLQLLAIGIDHPELVAHGLDDRGAERAVVEVARRIEAQTPRGSLVARVEPHTIAVAVDRADEPGAVALAERIIEAVRAPLRTPSGELYLTASAGVASGPRPGESVSSGELLRHALIAQNLAARAGGDRVVCFRPEHRDSVERTAALVTELRRATERREFALHLQPIVDLTDEHVVGVEALVRWHHPDRGVLEPGEFLALAHTTGLLEAIEYRVLELAGEHRGALDASWDLHVNLSAERIADDRLDDHLRAAFSPTGLHRLCLEITETAALSDPDSTVPRLERLREAGVSIVLDDFGTGHSSIGRLHRLPVDKVKIDRSFVAGLPDDGDSRRIVEVVLRLTEGLGLAAIAEGVERAEQRRALLDLGCRWAQGHLFARPAPAEELLASLRTAGPGGTGP
jgi:diguanylate cyclase (GGDEF)-like protein